MRDKAMVDIAYRLFDGSIVKTSVSEDVALALNDSDKKLLALKKQDDRHLLHMGYVEGLMETEVAEHRQIPDDVLDTQELNSQLYDAISKLTVMQRHRILAYYFEELNIRQIAEREGVTYGTVSKSIRLALKKIKKIFL